MRRERRFFLENESGNRIELMGRSGIWFNNISGLGFEENSEFADLSNGFFQKVNSQKMPQSSITGELTFVGRHPYEDYFRFANWVSKATELYLIYAPGVTEFRRKVVLQHLAKGELNGVGWLIVPVSFPALSPWHLPSVVNLDVQALEDDVVCFDDEDSGFDVGVLTEPLYAGSVTYIDPEGHLPSRFRLEYTGAVVNPVITLTGQISGTEYGRCALDGVELQEGETLILDTRVQEGGIWLQQGGRLTDLIDKVDLSFDPFPLMPVTEVCALRIAGDGDVAGMAWVKVFRYFYTV